MPFGFVVWLGNGQLGAGDLIVGERTGFNTQTNLGNGSWTWSGTNTQGQPVTNQVVNGSYQLGTDGTVYFVPNTQNVQTLTGASATTAPAFDDRTFGTNGANTIQGDGTFEVIYGGSGTGANNTGADTINAGSGNDQIYSGDGNDVVSGGGHDDTIQGGAGDDTIHGDNQTAPTTGTETLNWIAGRTNGQSVAGGITVDTGNMSVMVNFNNDGGNTGVTASTTTQFVGAEGFATNSGILISGGAGPNATTSFVFSPEAGSGLSNEVADVRFRINDVDTGSWQDVITIRAWDANGNLITVVLTPSGNDTVSGNTITGGPGNDTSASANGSVLVFIPGPVHHIELVYGNASTGGQLITLTNMTFTTLAPADGADVIDGGAGNDLIYGGGANDTITGGADNDTVYGGTGDDLLNGGGGNDRVFGDDGDDTVDGDAGDDVLFGGAGNDSLTGDAGNDTLDGGTGNDTMSDTGGTNTFYGGAGNDTITGGADADLIYGGDDADSISGGGGADSLFGHAGNDRMSGGDGSDYLDGGAGADTLLGDAGADTLIGGAGNDAIFGGNDNDTILIADTDGVDTIDGGNGGTDSDRIAFSNSATTSGIAVTFTGSEAGTYAFAGGASGSFTEIEALSGTAFADIMNAALSALAVTLSGNAGNDVLTGGGGDDLIDGGTGNDTLAGGAGADTLAGGAGMDFADYSASGQGVTVNLATGAASGGHAAGDTFASVEGVTGSAFDDRLTGFDAESTTTGDTWTNVFYGGAGNDTLDGAGGSDSLYGGADNDTIFGGTGNDLLDGGTGNDVLDGGIGNDSLTGGAGNDTLTGGAGSDAMAGGDDRDTFFAGVGDTVDGNEGGDDLDRLYVTGVASVAFVPGNWESGTITFVGGGTMTFQNIEELYVDGVLTRALDYTVEGTAGDDLIDIGYAGDPDGDRVDASDNQTGAQGDLIEGYGGNDRIFAADGDDTAYGGTGNDSVYGEDGNDTLFGDAGNDVLVGGLGNDSLYGGDNDDFLTGGLNDDLLSGGAGADVLFGDDGNDSLSGDAGDDILNGGNGRDTLSGGDNDDDLYGGLDDDILTGDAGADFLSGGLGNDSLSGGTGDDDLSGDEGDDSAAGGDGNDIVGGGAGNDHLTGDAGQDSLYGGFGADTVYGGTGNDLVYGEHGDDSVYGDGGDDTVYGGWGQDLVYGGDGNDLAAGRMGDDTVYGGAGDDTVAGGPLNFVGVAASNTGSVATTTTTLAGGQVMQAFHLGDGASANEVHTHTFADNPLGVRIRLMDLNPSETITILIDGQPINLATAIAQGWVTVDFGSTPYFIDANGNLASNGVAGAPVTPATITINQGFNSLVLQISAPGGAGGGVLYDLAPLSDEDRLYGDAGNDSMSGGIGNDLMYGGTDNDILLGGLGNDTLYGDAGNDTLHGEGGNDTLIGGAGNDSATGGAGDDRFVLGNGFGIDTILGGETGETTGDVLDASGLTTDALLDLSAGSAANPEDGTLTTAGGTATFAEIEAVFLGSGDDSLIGSSGDDRVAMGAGNDRADGGAGNDTIWGDGGNDTLTGGTGADTLYGGTGDDVIRFGQGDIASGGDGDDLFDLQDLAEPGSDTISVMGGAGVDTLKLGQLAQWNTLQLTGSGPGGLSGSILLDDGTTLNFTEIENIICFTPGTGIATPHGTRAVETLKVGDLVVTRDHGLRPIRWLGRRTVPAQGRFAPIRIRPGVVTGQEGSLLVSPQHRMLFQGYRAELLFGEREVLVAATHLMDGRLVTREEGGLVTYIHMMFDEHEIIHAQGAATESFHPGHVGLSAITAPAREELFALFPELRAMPQAFGPTARRCLRKREAELIRG